MLIIKVVLCVIVLLAIGFYFGFKTGVKMTTILSARIVKYHIDDAIKKGYIFETKEGFDWADGTPINTENIKV